MPRGAAKGERRGGRAKGTPNKDKFESLRRMREQLRKLEPAAFNALKRNVVHSDPAIRQRAAECIYDRLYGKAPQSVSLGEIDEETGKTERNELVFRIVKAKHSKED